MTRVTRKFKLLLTRGVSVKLIVNLFVSKNYAIQQQSDKFHLNNHGMADVEPVDSQWGRQVRGHADGQVHGPTHPSHREHGPWLGLQQAGHRLDVSKADGRSRLHKQLHCQVSKSTAESIF